MATISLWSIKQNVVMIRLNRKSANINEKLELKVVQFGEGNFLRAFVDYAFHTLNNICNANIGVAVVQPIEHGLVQILDEQDGLYTLFSKGYSDGHTIEEQHLISSIIKTINPYQDYNSFLELAKVESLEFVISNTTEAGIAFIESDNFEDQPPSSYPGKLTSLLYQRFKHFNGSKESGLIIIPCELINYNGDKLKNTVLQYADLWELENVFKTWIVENNTFHNTLVDRIVPGYPKDELAAYQEKIDYDDKLIVTSEIFFLWVIEGSEYLKKKLPFERTNLDVKIVSDMQPYRTRKVRILNGAHTSMVPLALLHGQETVRESINNPFVGNFVKDLIYDEIIPTLNLNKNELEEFAKAVLDRFRNPYIKHLLKSIALNSISKFKVRVLPSLLQYVEINGVIPPRLTFAFATLIRFYKGNWNGSPTPINDNLDIITFFEIAWKNENINEMLSIILSRDDYWGLDLRNIPNLAKTLNIALQEIENNGIEDGYNNFINKVSL